MRIKHYIIMSSSYSDGKRIAFDIKSDDSLDKKTIESIVAKIRERCDNDVPLSTHYIETDSRSWESIKNYDPFFETVERAKDLDEFIEKIKKDRVLTGLDIAKYILSKQHCTHLELEKLVYFCYADYLCEHSEKLFTDKIYAFIHGPVVDSVYHEFRNCGYDTISSTDDSGDSQVLSSVKTMPAKSRILFAKDGVKKLQSIDKTLETYGNYTAGTLVGFTHREGSPWSRVDSSRMFQLISDELIFKYHCVECV